MLRKIKRKIHCQRFFLNSVEIDKLNRCFSVKNTRCLWLSDNFADKL